MVHVVNLLALSTILSSSSQYLPILTWIHVDSTVYSISPSVLVGTVIMSVGAFLRVQSYAYLGRHFTYQLSIKRDHQLITSGPYAVVRHPSYTAAFIFMFGVLIAHLGPGSLFVELGLWSNPLGVVAGVSQLLNIANVYATMTLRTSKEDAMMRERFGDEWVQWEKRTPWRLVMGVY